MIFIILTLFTFLLFFYCYKKEPRRLFNGFLFNIFLLNAFLCFAYIDFTSNSFLMLLLFIFILIIGLVAFLFGIYILIIALLINARIVMKSERKTPANLLTLFVAMGLIIHLIWRWLRPDLPLSNSMNLFLSGFGLVAFYYICNLLSFISISFLFGIRRPNLNQDFIIILGSGLIRKKVPPLLASRINKAIEIYHKQKTYRKPPILIFSGGQGTNEEIPEAIAMQQYAIEQGIPIEDTLIEPHSQNTYQNMKFSKNLMDSRQPTGYRVIFVTNNYHTFRASLYAKKVGLNAQGIGSKTAGYFLPNAMIREYIALLMMNKKRHISVTLCFLLFGLILAFISEIIM